MGIGGIRALRELGIEVDLYHFNEGYAAFAGLELIREKMENENKIFELAPRRNQKRELSLQPILRFRQEMKPMTWALLMEIGANNGLSYEQLKGSAAIPLT